MTTHASHSHNAFERLEKLLERRAELDARGAELDHDIASARQATELALLLADVASVLREYPQRNLSEGQRLRINGVRSRVEAAKAVA